ncbi:MAG: hypothetical protein WD278_08230, partial [Pirellulales bacterium]
MSRPNGSLAFPHPGVDLTAGHPPFKRAAPATREAAKCVGQSASVAQLLGADIAVDEPTFREL